MVWSVCIDLPEIRKGPALELVLSGIARDLIREIPLDVKANGRLFDAGNGRGQIHWNGLDFIILVLNQHFAHLGEEESTRVLLELYNFRRRSGESMDAYLAR